MLDYLVNWAKVKYTEEMHSLEKVNLSSIISSSYKILDEYASQKGITFINKVGEDIYVSADKKMLLSIFQNLFSNAIKFSPLRGQITAEAFEKEEKIVVRIVDSGVGMPEELQKKLFKSKPVSSQRGTLNEHGTGIGLMLVKEFVEKNRGGIWSESEENKGTSIYFTLDKA